MSDSSGDTDDQQSELQKLEEKLRNERKKHRDEISKLKDELDEKTKVINGERKKHRNEINELKDEIDEKDRKIADLKEKLKKFKKGKDNSNSEIRKTDNVESQKTNNSNWNREDGNNRNTIRHPDSDSFYSPNSNDLFYSENSGSNYATPKYNTGSKAHAGNSYHDTHPNPPGIPSTAYPLTAEPQNTSQSSIFDVLSSLVERKRIPSASSGIASRDAYGPSSYLSSSNNYQQQPKRITYTPSQKEQLENAYNNNHYMKGEDKKQMAASLNITEKQVQTWFNNRRARDKK